MKYLILILTLVVGGVLVPAPAHAATLHEDAFTLETYPTGLSTPLDGFNLDESSYVLIKVEAAGLNGDRRSMIDVKLTCGDQWNRATSNTSYTIRPVLYVRLISDAESCIVEGRAATTNATPADRVYIRYYRMISRAGYYKTTATPTLHPTPVLLAGTAKDVHPTVLNAAGFGYLHVFADAKLTSCHQVGGSRENGSALMCTDELLTFPDHKVRAKLVVSQLAASGTGYCQTVVVKEKLVTITAKEHHDMAYLSADYPVSTSPLCTRDVRAKLYLYAEAGNTVVHQGGTIVGIWR